MKIILQDNNRFVLRFDKGEEVVSELKKFLSEKQITASSFSAIGACSMAELSYFNLETKAYQTRKFEEDLEIVSLTGNSAILGGETALHSHCVLSGPDFKAFGGHLNKLVVSATCEVFLTKLEGKMERKLEPETKLNLLA